MGLTHARTVEGKREEHFWCGVDAIWDGADAVCGGSVVRRIRRWSGLGVVEF